MQRRSVRARLVASISMLSLCLTACATIPSNSEPQALRSFSNTPDEDQVGPEQDQEPDLLVRDFYAANARPAQQYQLARTYLTPELAKSWSPSPEIMVVNRLDVNLAQSKGTENSSTAASYQVSGTTVGTVSVGGAYTPRNEEFRAKVDLVQVDGQWRIATAPDRIVVERSALRNWYAPHVLSFFDPTSSFLVGDRRWIYEDSSSLDTALLSLLVEGPSSQLAPGVLNEIPPDAVISGKEAGVYRFTGFLGMDDEMLTRIVAQMVWTLALGDIPAPYRFNFDGVDYVHPLTGSKELSVDDFPEFNPQATKGKLGSNYALRDGRLLALAGTPQPAPGTLGGIRDIESAEISATTGSAALVQHKGEDSTLEIVAEDGMLSEVLSAATLTRPTFEPNAKNLWTVVDGKTVVRVSRAANRSEVSQTEVEVPDLGDIPGAISVLRLSWSGVRVAFIVNGHVYVGTVARTNAGERKVYNVFEIMPSIGDSAISLDWALDGTLIVGTSNPDTPVWRIENDGSSAQALPSSNLTAPVVSVAATATTIYVTDARAALELSIGDGTTSTFWREVQGLEGARSITVVPR